MASSLSETVPAVLAANPSFKCWAFHLDAVFHARRDAETAASLGVNAVASFLEAARVENETKARRVIARLLWTAKLLVATSREAAEKMDSLLLRHSKGVVAYNWLFWCAPLRSSGRLQAAPTGERSSSPSRLGLRAHSSTSLHQLSPAVGAGHSRRSPPGSGHRRRPER